MREELFQEGMIGLLFAARKYNPDVGVRFGTYATYWIMQRIRQHLRESRTIRFPHHVWNRKVKIDDAKRRLGGTPSLIEIAEYLGMPLREVKEIFEVENVCSLDDTDRHPSPAAARNQSPEELSISDASERYIIERLFMLDVRSRDIIMRHYGISGPAETLSQIAKSYGFSRERIRQIRNEALKFLRYKW